MRVTLGLVFALAYTDWRQAWRGLGLWLALLLVALSFAGNIVPAHHILSWRDDDGLSILTLTVTFAALLGSFFVVPTYHREQVIHIADLIWIRPLSGGVYIAGKIAGAGLVLATLLAELIVLVVLYQVTGGGTIGLPLLIGVALAAVPALLLAAVLYMGCAVLLRHPLVGYLIALAFCSVFGLFLTQSMVLLWNPWAHSLFYNRIVGFGPDLPLLLANRLFYLGVLLLLAGSVLALFVRREHRALTGQWQRRSVLSLLIAGLLVGGVAVLSFQAAVQAAMPSGPVVAPPAVPLSVHGYALDLQLNPVTGSVRGVVHFSIRNTGNTPIAAFPLYLNDGLRVTVALVNGQQAVIRSAALFATLTPAHALAPGSENIIQATYEGRYKLLRAQYGSDRQGYLGHMTDLSPAPLHQSIIGAGLAILFRDGDWYPLPWTQATMTQTPAPLGWRDLRVRVPAGPRLLASTSQINSGRDGQVATWQLAGQLPAAVLAVVPQGYARITVPGGAAYVPSWDTTSLATRYAPYVTALSDLMRFFRHSSQPVAVVITPLAMGSGAVHVHAAVGDGLALMPMDSLDQTPEGADVTISQLAPPAPYRAALDDLAVAWWENRLPQPDLPVPTAYGPSVDLPTGYIGMAVARDRAGYDPTGMLAGYTGVAIAARRLGPRLYVSEMALRRATAAYIVHSATVTPMVLLQLGQGPLPLATEMRALGLSGRLAPFDMTPALDDLSRIVGPDRLYQTLIALSTAGETPDNANSVACALTSATGQSVAALMNRYLVSKAGWMPPVRGCA